MSGCADEHRGEHESRRDPRDRRAPWGWHRRCRRGGRSEVASRIEGEYAVLRGANIERAVHDDGRRLDVRRNEPPPEDLARSGIESYNVASTLSRVERRGGHGEVVARA